MQVSAETASQEKNQAALSSVVAAVFLTAFKIVVGIATGSLGILAEAAHSGLDLVAALVTWFAVRIADRPSDQRHLYGHGKVENLSALFETLLLLVTCVWIIYEALQRLFVKEVEVDASVWAFLVMAVSIGIDFGRSRVLRRAAIKHNSQALEADALHFSTDIWSSSVVIVGLVGVKLGEWFPQLRALSKADAGAALGVALIVIYVSLQLGRRTVEALIDTAPRGLDAQVRQAVEGVPGVVQAHQVRVRASGAQLFVDVHVVIDDETHLHDVHDLTNAVETAVRQQIPRADVTVHPEPLSEVERTNTESSST